MEYPLSGGRLVIATLVALTVQPALLDLAHAAPVEVTVCGQIVPARARAFLAADLDCIGFSGTAVILGKNARFDLQGFTLSGGRYAVRCLQPCSDGSLSCTARCRINGRGGTITAAEANGITGDKMRVQNVTIEENGGRGIDSVGRAKITDVVIRNNGNIGVSGAGVSANRCTITGNGGGISANAGKGMSVRNSTVTGNVPADLAGAKRPRVRKSTCDRSFRRGGGDWNVCSFD